MAAEPSLFPKRITRRFKVCLQTSPPLCFSRLLELELEPWTLQGPLLPLSSVCPGVVIWSRQDGITAAHAVMITDTVAWAQTQTWTGWSRPPGHGSYGWKFPVLVKL